MTSGIDTLEEARRLLARGFERSKAETDPLWAEFRHLYEAQDLLVRTGFEEFDPQIQQQFAELIPVNFVLKQKLNSSFKDLYSSSVKRRVTASQEILDEVCGEFGIAQMLWMRHPDSVKSILPSLNDSESRVVANILYSLGHIYGRFQDLRIVDAIEPFYSSPMTNLLDAVISASFEIDTSSKWRFVLGQLESCQNQKRIRLLLSNAQHATGHNARMFFDRLLDIWNTKRVHGDTRMELVSAFAELITTLKVSDVADLIRTKGTSELVRAVTSELEFFESDPKLVADFAALTPQR